MPTNLIQLLLLQILTLLKFLAKKNNLSKKRNHNFIYKRKTMDIFYLLVKIMALAIMFTNGGNSSKACMKLSNECRIEESLTNDWFVCNSLKKSFEMKVEEYIKCKNNNHTLYNQVYFMLSSPEILDNSHNLTSISDFFLEAKKINNRGNTIRIAITYTNLKGFDLNTSFSTNDSNLNNNRAIIKFNSNLLYSKFQFFLNNQLQVSCQDYHKWNLTQPNSFLQVKTDTMNFKNIKFSKAPICPLYLKNANIDRFFLEYQLNTFYKRNYLSFSTFDFNSSDMAFLNANIETLVTYENEKINIDSNSFLNKYVFHTIKSLDLSGEINSIEKDIFRPFKQLTTIIFEARFFEKLYRKGIEWISSVNFDLNVNLSNKSQLHLKVNHTKIIELTGLSNAEIKNMKFQNEDFCLFIDYPFNQLIVFKIHSVKNLMRPKYTCTLQWILQYHHLYAQYPNIVGRKVYSDFLTLNREKILNKFEKCDFEKMIDNCNRKKFHTRDNEWTINDKKEMAVFLEFILIILQPIICSIGLLFNIMVIYTLSISDNKKDLKTVQYSYLKMVSVSNIIVLLIRILSPLYECQLYKKSRVINQELGIYCSPYHKLIVVQYYKIIFAEFLCSVFMLLSNFGYVGFSICRLSMIGKEQTKLTKWFSEIPIVYYIIVSTIISVGLSVIKLFKYEVNTSNPFKEYPIPLDKKYIYELLSLDSYLDFKKMTRLILIFYAVSDLVSYFLFIPINFILDLVLILKMKKALSEKINLQVKKENEILFRVKLLAFTFLLSNFLMKLPSMFKSIFNIANLFNSSLSLRDKFIPPEDKWYYSYFDCFEKLASILFIISISGIILFYYLFDKNFKFGLKIALSKLTSSEKSHLEYVTALERSRTKK